MSNNTPAGYLDRFSESKAWQKLLFRPGKAIQSSELNEMQSVLQFQSKRLGDTIFSSVSINSGCEVVNTGTTVTIGVGEFYALGLTHKFAGGSTTISGTGLETVGILITPRVVTESDDITLKDQAVGSAAYGQPGSHRLSFQYTVAVDDAKAVRIATYVDGALSKTYNTLRPMIEPIRAALEARTFDEAGNFTVEPYEVEVNDVVTAVNSKSYVNNYDFAGYKGLRVVVRKGNAYVKGRKFINYSTALIVPRPLTTGQRTDEPIVYQTSNTSKVYGLDFSPVASVDSVSSTVEKVEIDMTRGNIGGGVDEIPLDYQPVVSIQLVKAGAKTYINGTDYQLGSSGAGDTVDWSLSGDEAVAGSSYKLTVYYIKQMVKGTRIIHTVDSEDIVRSAGDTATLTNTNATFISRIVDSNGVTYLETTDYTIATATGVITWVASRGPAVGIHYFVDYSYWATEVEGDYLCRDSFRTAAGDVVFDHSGRWISGDAVDFRKNISFNCAGDKPVNATTTQVTYKYYKGRQDLLVITSAGDLQVLNGTPAIHSTAPPTGNGDLILASIDLPAEAKATDISLAMRDTQRLTQSDLQTLHKSVTQLKFTAATQQLASATSSMNVATEKRGIFIDAFDDFTQLDHSHPEFNATINLLNHTMLTGSSSETKSLVSTDSTISDYWLLPFSSVVLTSNPYFTGSIQVNAYTTVNLGGQVVLSPAFDKWQESSTTAWTTTGATVVNTDYVDNSVFINNTSQLSPLTTTSNVNSYYNSHTGEWKSTPWSLNRSFNWYSLGLTNSTSKNKQTQSSTSSVSQSVAQTNSQSVAQIDSVVTRPIAVARQITVQVSASNFIINERAITATFDGTEIVLTPTGSTQTDTKFGSVKADAAGKFTASFVVPANVSTGTHSVQIVGRGASGTSAGSRTDVTYRSEGMFNAISKHTIVTPIINRTITNTTTNTTNTTNQTVTNNEYTMAVYQYQGDPVAQTFFADRDYFITQIGVYLTRKAGVSEAIKILIVPVENGQPDGLNILATATRMSSTLTAAIDGSQESVFVFSNPVHVKSGKEYAFIVKCDSNETSLAISTTGNKDTVLGYVNKNPAMGVLMTSSNLTTWTADQNSDVKFKLYRADFSSTRTITFNQINFATPRCRFEMAGVYVEPDSSTRVQWQYSIDANSTYWHDFKPLQMVDLKTTTNFVKVRAIMTGSSNISPVIHDSGYVKAYSWKLTGSYIARQFVLDEADARYVDMWIDVALEGCTITPQIRLDDSAAFVTMLEVTADAKQLDQTAYTRHYRYDSGSNTALKQKIQLRINMTSPNIMKTPLIQNLRAIARTI